MNLIIYRIKTAIAIKARGLFIAAIDVLASKLKECASKLPDLPVAFEKFLENNLLLAKLTTDTKNHIAGAADKAKALVIQIREDYRSDALYVETLVNASQDPSLAKEAGFEVISFTKTKNGSDLTITNTNILSRLHFKTHKVKHYHYYLIECIQKFDDGSPDVITEKSMPGPISNVDGFISGALYLIRVRAVLAQGILANWTDYVLIRVN